MFHADDLPRELALDDTHLSVWADHHHPVGILDQDVVLDHERIESCLLGDHRVRQDGVSVHDLLLDRFVPVRAFTGTSLDGEVANRRRK